MLLRHTSRGDFAFPRVLCSTESHSIYSFFRRIWLLLLRIVILRPIHAAECMGSPSLLRKSVSSVPLSRYTTVRLSIHLLADIWAVSILNFTDKVVMNIHAHFVVWTNICFLFSWAKPWEWRIWMTWQVYGQCFRSCHTALRSGGTVYTPTSRAQELQFPRILASTQCGPSLSFRPF